MKKGPLPVPIPEKLYKKILDVWFCPLYIARNTGYGNILNHGYWISLTLSLRSVSSVSSCVWGSFVCCPVCSLASKVSITV